MVDAPITDIDTMKKLALEFYRLEQHVDAVSIDRMLDICDAMRSWRQQCRGQVLTLEEYHLVQTATGILSGVSSLRKKRRKAEGGRQTADKGSVGSD